MLSAFNDQEVCMCAHVLLKNVLSQPGHRPALPTECFILACPISRATHYDRAILGDIVGSTDERSAGARDKPACIFAP